MSWLTSFFVAGPDAASKVLDAGIKGLDALVFTDEEKATYIKSLGDQWLKLQEMLGEETSIRGVTRRILALLVLVPYVGLNLLAAGVYLWRADYASFLFNVANGQFGWMALGVMAFYFGPYMIQRMLPGSKKGE